MNVDKFSDEFQVELYPKKVENHTKNGKTKRVRFGVTDKDIFDEPMVCVGSLKAFEILHNKLVEYKDKINQLESDLKQAIDESSSKNDIEIHHQDEINQLKQQHIDEMEKLKAAHETEINQIKAEQEILVNKEYLDKYNDVINEKKKLSDEIEALRNTKFNYAIQYNSLLNEVKRISWFDAVRNKHKDIANDYDLIQLPTDEQSMIDINKADK